ncbi:MAG: trigger factor [Betaproteobacteria bacterium]|nr:MAG: trigger factor [Betaproteobacteria bacterium]TMH41097.1 MAG: trigger factor [Betaproteobacteria bacterium]
MANVETLGTLERRVSMSVPAAEIEREVDTRLKKLARNVKMPGFRPGKVPLKLIAQTYGPQVRSEVLSDAVQKAFTDVVKEANLKVAGFPRIEKKDGGDTAALEFSATFEVYPEVKLGDLAGVTIERPQVTVDDAAVDRTIGILRKQRTRFVPVERPAKEGDRLTVDFSGTIDGEPFAGGKGENFVFALGEGRMLPEFDAAAQGMRAGETKTFELTFPADYHGKEVAGKRASFELSMKSVEEPQLPEVDAEFAKSLGIAEGDVAKMRSEIRANVERETNKRIEARVKAQVLQALLDRTPLELPKSLVQMEAQQLVERAAADLQARGMKPGQIPLDPAAFEATAKRRVALGLIIGELARAENLQPKPAEVRAAVEQEAATYESPAEVVKWFYMQPQRLSEMEGMALEANVVKWVLGRATVVDKPVAFDDLMGSNA